MLEPEHRFYGESLPYGSASYEAEHLKGVTWTKMVMAQNLDQKRYQGFLTLMLLLACEFIFIFFVGMR